MGISVSGPTFALIGVGGHIARRHLEAIRDTGGTLIACHDITDSVGILDSYFPNERFFTDEAQFEDFLSGSASRPDYFVVCTPNDLHAAHAALHTTGLYSGKHKTTGMNVQVACTIHGKLAWISDPVNGSRHDNYCQGESGVLLPMNPKNWIGDKGYIGNNMITPFRKPAGGELLDWQKEYNSEVNKIRWMIEQVISHFKNWTIMHTDYRRPFTTFETTISAVIGLHFYRTA